MPTLSSCLYTTRKINWMYFLRVAITALCSYCGPGRRSSGLCWVKWCTSITDCSSKEALMKQAAKNGPECFTDRVCHRNLTMLLKCRVLIHHYVQCQSAIDNNWSRYVTYYMVHIILCTVVTVSSLSSFTQSVFKLMCFSIEVFKQCALTCFSM